LLVAVQLELCLLGVGAGQDVKWCPNAMSVLRPAFLEFLVVRPVLFLWSWWKDQGWEFKYTVRNWFRLYKFNLSSLIYVFA
jgi:hypothetical protein